MIEHAMFSYCWNEMFLVTDRDTFVRVIFTVVVLQRDGAVGDNLRESFIHIALFETVSVDISERTAVTGFLKATMWILFLKLCPKTTGLAEEMLTWLDAKVRMLGKELEKIPTE